MTIKELKKKYASITAKGFAAPPGMMPFGKYKGQTLEAVLADPGNYVEWLLSNRLKQRLRFR